MPTTPYEKYLSEFIYGSIDGIITTFSIVAGSAGGNLSQRVILILGISNVLSDGYSMGVSRYLSALAEQEQHANLSASSASSTDSLTWLVDKPPWVAGWITFVSFVSMGVLPILPYAILPKTKRVYANKLALMIATLLFFVVGIMKGYIIGPEISSSCRRHTVACGGGTPQDGRAIAYGEDGVSGEDVQSGVSGVSGQSGENVSNAYSTYLRILKSGLLTMAIGLSASGISYSVGKWIGHE